MSHDKPASLEKPVAELRRPLPDFVEIKEGIVHLKTESGEFLMSPDVFDLYLRKYTVTEEDFRYELPSFLRKEKYDHNPRSIALRQRVRELLQSKGLIPENYLDKYEYNGNEKIMELWNVIPTEILKEITYFHVQYHFTSHSANEKLTFIEHGMIASSSSQFFGQAFMGDFRADPEWQTNVRENRKNFLLKPGWLKQQAIILYLHRDRLQFGEISQSFRTDETYGNKVREKLRPLYERVSDGSVAFDDLDYARVVVMPVPYDKNMAAFPKPKRIEFLFDTKVVAVVDDPAINKILRPKKEDCTLAEILKGPDGKDYPIEFHTRGPIHTLTIGHEKDDWYIKYLDRVAKSL